MTSPVADPSVLVLQHADHETPGLVGQALQAKRIGLEFVRAHRGEPVPRELGDAVGLLVMGGPMGVYEADRYPHLRDELRLIEVALSEGRPVLGICLGSQLVAHALGADVRKAQKEVGWHTVTLTEDGLLDPLFKGLESSFMGFHWHGDVFDLPPGVQSYWDVPHDGAERFLFIQGETSSAANGRNMVKITFNWFDELTRLLQTRP